MKKPLRFIDEKYQEELLRWLTYLAVPTSILFIVGYLIERDIGKLLMVVGFITSFTAFMITHFSLKYGGKYILSISSLGGLSYGMIIMYIGINILDVGAVKDEYYFLIAVILMGIFSIAFSRKKFSQRDQWIRAGMSMMVTFTAGAVLGVVLALLFSFLGGIGVLIGFVSGVIIMVSYLGKGLGEYFNLDKDEIYSPKGAGIIGAGIGGLLGIAMNQFYIHYYTPFYYEINAMEISLALVVNLISALVTGLLVGYLTQKMKKRIDEN